MPENSQASPAPPGWPEALQVVAGTLLALAGTAWLVGGPGSHPDHLRLAGGILLLQWVAALPSIWARSEHAYDLVGSLTYLAGVLGCAWVAHSRGSLAPRAALAGGLVAVWALRLGSFLFLRVRREGKDGRFDALKVSPPRFLIAWTLQGLWVYWTALPAWVLLLGAGAGARGGLGSFGPVAWIGLALWALGFLVEVVADAQKAAFRGHPENRGRWIETGLWAWSRHPNYCGEITLWFGLTLFASESFRGGEWAAWISPVFVYLLLSRGSGVPLLEERAEARWGEDPGYQAYRERTPVLFPWTPKA